MNTYEFLTVFVAVLAVVISVTAVWFNAMQTKRVGEGLILQQQISRANLVEHFTSRFFELLKSGDLQTQIEEPDRAYQYWSLLATEFYFFHHGILPAFMYSLWMIDLARLYGGENGDRIWKSHSDFLETYSVNYSLMTQFFERIRKVAGASGHGATRSKTISDFVLDWNKTNEAQILD